MVKKLGVKNKTRAKRQGFVYRKRTADQVKKRAEQKGGMFDSEFIKAFDMFKPKEGENLIRILPPTWEGHDHYGLDIWVHSYVGSSNSTYLCPAKMKNEPCPICDAAAEAFDAGEKEEANDLKASRRVLCWVIDRDEKKPVPMLYSMSWSMDRDIAVLCTNKRTGEVLLIDDPYEGYDVSFQRQGSGINTKYFGYQIEREPTPIDEDEDVQESILEFVQENSLPDILRFYDAEYLQKVISGTAEERDADLDGEEEEEPEEEEENYRRRTTTKKRSTKKLDTGKRRLRDEEEELEEEEEDYPEEEGEEPEEEEIDEEEEPEEEYEEEEYEEEEEPEEEEYEEEEYEEEEYEEEPRRRSTSRKRVTTTRRGRR